MSEKEKKYKLVDAKNNELSCGGCAANNDIKLCASIGKCWVGTKNMIWKEAKDDNESEK